MPTSAADLSITLPGTLRQVGGWWVIEIPKGWVALTRAQVLEGLKHGKRLKRRLALQARQRTEDNHAGAGPDGGQ
jgi:hypothetical protein